MPGLRRQAGISSYTNSLYHADMHNTQLWDQQQYSIVSSRRPVSNALKQGREKPNYLGTTTTKPVNTVPIRYGSTESDDLQAMVHDFIENEPLDYMDGTDGDTPAPAKKLIDTLQVRFQFHLFSTDRQAIATAIISSVTNQSCAPKFTIVPSSASAGTHNSRKRVRTRASEGSEAAIAVHQRRFRPRLRPRGRELQSRMRETVRCQSSESHRLRCCCMQVQVAQFWPRPWR